MCYYISSITCTYQIGSNFCDLNENYYYKNIFTENFIRPQKFAILSNSIHNITRTCV